MPHKIVLLALPDFELLDVTGPASVFASANYALELTGRKPAYSVELASPEGGPLQSCSILQLHSRAVAEIPPDRIDTLLVTGGHTSDLARLAIAPDVAQWVIRCASAAARFGSICTGTFILAELGLIDGRRVTTHWEACDLLTRSFPAVDVDPDALFVVDDSLWTSAGVTAGIDLALAMIARDVGVDIANMVARGLVLYARRPGHQSQFSPLLRAQARADHPFGALADWIQANLDGVLDVATLAAQAGLSERSFHRKFMAAMGMSPARYVENIRLDAARMLLSRGLPIKAVAAQVGLSPTARFSKVFTRRFGMAPNLYQKMHAEP
ncbi:helix-turn-helix domain-containing protein [Sphingosinicella sp. LHD-64]|uniref:GlxA family transcriptional regulator n=1 Tax=Sphingosinicella sp. LHD-64 TaxID=3072139 RepID=UPI00280E1926|nr:helix-turn-helix domain-containing protein [Sphingosinicella sp. LHD-64]MDQ8755785.1 helix-turn-helix domain-containing protein [Sphingosinicella sp. LHD-64]